MAYETGTATDTADLLTKLKLFVDTTMTPADERWTVERYSGYEAVVFSTELGSFESYLGFDEDINTAWSTALGSATPSYLGCKFLSTVDITSFAITARTVAPAPRTFSLDWSDDGAAWTTLETFTPATWTINERRTFVVSAASPGARLYWRINVTVNDGDADYTRIGRVEFFEDIGGNEFNWGTDRQLILNGPGLAAADEIYVGIQMYSKATSDIYNWKVAGFTGYVASNDFDSQPGSSGNIGVPLADATMTYWLIASGRRIAMVIKVDTTYQVFYLGMVLPYATPGQFPYPVMAAGVITSDALTRYSDTGLEMPWENNSGNLRLRFTSGAWLEAECWPYENAESMRDTLTEYSLMPIVLTDSTGVYGEVDGIYHVSGFSNFVENLVQIGGLDHLVVQNIYRTGIDDYFAMALE